MAASVSQSQRINVVSGYFAAAEDWPRTARWRRAIDSTSRDG